LTRNNKRGNEDCTHTNSLVLSKMRLRQRFVPIVVLTCAVSGLLKIADLRAVNQVRERPPNQRLEAGAERTWAEQTLKSLPLEEKVGQLLQVRYYADYTSFDSADYQHVRDEIHKYHIGSLVFGMHFDKGGPIRSLPLDAAKVANQLQRDSKLPLLLAADLERGVATRLHDVPSFPWPMAFGAVSDAAKVERFAAITGREARAVGIHWALAPVADVNSNPANPVINDRSFGEDPERVGTLVTAFIRGAHENGLLATAKHFPGNGDTSIDSHRAVASVDANIEHLEKIEFPPFKAAISAGVDSIMLAHARVPALEPDADKITTISAEVVSRVLKAELGFKGVVVTDALEMRGITKLYDPAKGSPTARAAVDALKAGCDVIMIPTDLDGAFHAIVDAVQNGEIPETRIDESVQRILGMKAAVGLDKNRFVDLDQVAALTGKSEDIAFGQQVADEAVTLVRNDAQLLPLAKENVLTPEVPQVKRRLVVVVLAEALETANGKEFEREMRARRPDAAIFRFDGRFSSAMIPELQQASADADQIVLATYVVHGAARQVVVDGRQTSYFGLQGPGGRLFQEMVTKYPRKTVVIALGSPYLIQSFPQIETYICTYAMASSSEISVVKALFGEIQNHARLPVTLPGVAARGFSLPWPTTPGLGQRALAVGARPITAER
jgi:beta-N-acetylhexosaminidase